MKVAGELTHDFVADVSSSFQVAVTRHLGMRTYRAVKYCMTHYPKIQHLVVSGGVAQNECIQGHLSDLAEENGIVLKCPPQHLCSDNGVMIAWSAIEYISAGLKDRIERSDLDSVDFIPRYICVTSVNPPTTDTSVTWDSHVTIT
jgi:N6-L-threonylcarbamoyladenine synthase